MMFIFNSIRMIMLVDDPENTRPVSSKVEASMAKMVSLLYNNNITYNSNNNNIGYNPMRRFRNLMTTWNLQSSLNSWKQKLTFEGF